MPRDRRFEHAMAEVHRYIRALMARARERMQPQEEPRNLLEAMLVLRDAPGADITDDDVAANVMTLLVAGEDTTATSIAWALLFLGTDDALQARVAADARHALGDAPVCPTYDAMRALDSCEAVCTEASRLHPVAPYLSFEPLEDVQLSGVRLPAGTKMFMLNRPAMLDARHFADAARYDPQRWLRDRRRDGDSDAPTHEPRAWMQFGAGPRVCPGRHLASVEMRLVASMLMANFVARLATDPANIHEVCAFTMVPSAMPMRLQLRDKPVASH
ncbi:cytochrome P450 [Caballeronia sp. Sq4a]|uniref:cytochrome P450 n=1 Tax=Caballeronia sp. Sq4a TaxID=2878152 RepID=UPI0020BDB917